MTISRGAKVQQLMQELELSIEHAKNKSAVLSNTINATAALMQEATQRKSQLMLENELLLSLLRLPHSLPHQRLMLSSRNATTGSTSTASF
jgi:hypothetical protein